MVPRPSLLQADLARRIVGALRAQGAKPGQHLVETELCAVFAVSRTPIRGALQVLAADGVIKPRDGRGWVLARLPANRDEDTTDAQEQTLFDALALARARRTLPDTVTQQDLVRRFHTPLGDLLRVLNELAELGLASRKPGNGWAFTPDTARILAESYAFRRALEPQMLLQPGFRMDRAWADATRTQHLALRDKTWKPGDGAAFHHLNAQFHAGLAAQSGNRIMARAMQRQNQLRRFVGADWDYPQAQIRSAIADHLEILSALEAGYADKAAALMLHHLALSAPPFKGSAASQDA